MLYLGNVFFAGIYEGYSQQSAIINGEMQESEAYDPSSFNMTDIYFKPHYSTILQATDSIEFNGGKTFLMLRDRETVLIPNSEYESDYSWAVNLMYVASLALYVLLLVQFIRFIVNINKGNIFDIKNVSRLRRFAWYLISISVLKCIAGMIEDYMLSNLSLNLDGYTLSSYWELPWDTMLLGLLALLMAQVWSYGLQLKEDQALTI